MLDTHTNNCSARWAGPHQKEGAIKKFSEEGETLSLACEVELEQFRGGGGRRVT